MHIAAITFVCISFTALNADAATDEQNDDEKYNSNKNEQPPEVAQTSTNEFFLCNRKREQQTSVLTQLLTPSNVNDSFSSQVLK
jgi:hypothetical protein